MLILSTVYLEPAQNDLKYLAWHRTTSSRSSSSRTPLGLNAKDDSDDPVGNLFDNFCMISGSHASTLDRLYAWERKLYEEVKVQCWYHCCLCIFLDFHMIINAVYLFCCHMMMEKCTKIRCKWSHSSGLTEMLKGIQNKLWNLWLPLLTSYFHWSTYPKHVGLCNLVLLLLFG